jgi:putative copper resistance protein D
MWHAAWWWNLAIAAGAAAYGVGVARLRRTGGWPWPRTAAFLVGSGVLAVTVNSGIDVYAHPLFWVHMVQHLLLIMVVPPLLVAGQPLRLAMAVQGAHGWVARLVHGRLGLLAHPIIGCALYTVVIVGTHLSGFMQSMLTHHGVHEAEKILYLAAGCLLFWPLIAHEPVRWRVPYALRIAVLLLAMTVDTFVGLVLMLTDKEPFPAYNAMHRSWEPLPVSDLHGGGAIMWCGGDAIMFVLCLAIAAQWILDRGRRDQLGGWLDAVRRGALAAHGATVAEARALDRAADLDSDDTARVTYNAMLARLNSGHRAQKR